MIDKSAPTISLPQRFWLAIFIWLIVALFALIPSYYVWKDLHFNLYSQPAQASVISYEQDLYRYYRRAPTVRLAEHNVANYWLGWDSYFDEEVQFGALINVRYLLDDQQQILEIKRDSWMNLWSFALIVGVLMLLTWGLILAYIGKLSYIITFNKHKHHLKKNGQKVKAQVLSIEFDQFIDGGMTPSWNSYLLAVHAEYEGTPFKSHVYLVRNIKKPTWSQVDVYLQPSRIEDYYIDVEQAYQDTNSA